MRACCWWQVNIPAQAQLEIPVDMMAGSGLKSAIKKRLWSDGEQTVLICINKWLTWLLTNDEQSELTFQKLASGSIFSSISILFIVLISSILNSEYGFIYLLYNSTLWPLSDSKNRHVTCDELTRPHFLNFICCAIFRAATCTFSNNNDRSFLPL